MTNTQLKSIAKMYGLYAVKYYPALSGYRNKNFPISLKNGQMVNFVLLKNEPNILITHKNALYLSEHLAKYGMPTRTLNSPKILNIKYSKNVQYGVLYNYLPGGTIPWESYTMKHIKNIGATMSNMHYHAKQMPQNSLGSVAKISYKQAKTMASYFNDKQVKNAMAKKLNITLDLKELNKISLLLSKLDNLPNKQPLHMDFVRSNILFYNDSPDISGIIDFEKAAYGHPVFDIARTMAFLIIDCKYKQKDKVYKYFLHSGYKKRGKNNYTNLTVKQGNISFDLLEELINFYLLYDLYKFLKHNPYEYLQQNEHYTRTRNELLKRGLISHDFS